jgi:GT2 family glycosyltransferase
MAVPRDQRLTEYTSGGLTDELVLCTRNRPDEVIRCLGSIAAQTRVPTSVRVVDSSDDDATETVARVSAPPSLVARLVYQRAKPGLTAQRNSGVRAGTADLVHFVDDDVVLDPGYVAAIVEIFAANGDGLILGAGGLVTNAHRHPVPRLKRVFGLYGNGAGSVLPSGRNVLAVDLTSQTEVEWLSGCSMSFRRSVFDKHSFNEELLGYGLGEDVEFTYRVHQDGRLVVTPRARLEHLESACNRMDVEQYTREELIARSRRVRTRIGRLRMRRYWWSVIGQIAALTVEAAIGRSAVAGARLRVSLAGVRVVVGEQLRRRRPPGGTA